MASVALALLHPLLGQPSSGTASASGPSASTATRSVASVDSIAVLSLDPGPATFPVAAGGRAPVRTAFRTVVASRLGPAIKITHPAGMWSAHQVAVMWLSHTALRLSQHPGVRSRYSHVFDPGASSHWTTPPSLTPVTRWQVGLAATFNGGFKLTNGDSRGGYWDSGYGVNGRSGVVADPTGRRTLTSGAQSLVIYKNGSWAIGTWNHEVRMSAQVRFVRQELVPLIDRSAINPLTASRDCQLHWGITVNNFTPGWYRDHCSAWRSGIGTTAAGDLVYVSGRDLLPSQLALVLRQAGAVRAMQLDINTQWVSAMFYNAPRAARGTPATPHILSSPYNKATHYITGTARAGTAANRDFFAAYLR